MCTEATVPATHAAVPQSSVQACRFIGDLGSHGGTPAAMDISAVHLCRSPERDER